MTIQVDTSEHFPYLMPAYYQDNVRLRCALRLFRLEIIIGLFKGNADSPEGRTKDTMDFSMITCGLPWNIGA